MTVVKYARVSTSIPTVGVRQGKGYPFVIVDKKTKTLKHHCLGIFSHKKKYQNVLELKLLHEDSGVAPKGNKINVSLYQVLLGCSV